MTIISCVFRVIVAVLLAYTWLRRRAIRRWWVTCACPHPDCTGRLSAKPLYEYSSHRPVIERCDVCNRLVLYGYIENSMFMGYRRVQEPTTEKPSE